MSSRAKQLLLEVLLLAEKYSDRDIAWARDQLTSGSRGADLLELVAKPQDVRAPYKRGASERPAPNLGSKRAHLVESLIKSRSSHSLRRAENVATRLNIKLTGQSHEDLVREIETGLSKLDEGQLSKFLRSYKTISDVDDAYIGLANTLMRPERQD